MGKRICPQCGSTQVEYCQEDNSYRCRHCGGMQIGDGPVVNTVNNTFSENRLETANKTTRFNSKKYEKVSCPQCGSTNLTYLKENNTYRCPYCDTAFLRNDDITNNVTNTFKKKATVYVDKKPVSKEIRQKWITFFELLLWFSYIGLFTYIILALGPVISNKSWPSCGSITIDIQKGSVILLLFTLVITTMTHIICLEKWTGHIITGLVFGAYILGFIAPVKGADPCFWYIIWYFVIILIGFVFGRIIKIKLGGGKYD